MIITSLELSSVVFAQLFHRMLGLSCEIIQRSDQESKDASYIVDIDTFDTESLLKEYERRHGELPLFHSCMHLYASVQRSIEEHKDKYTLEDLKNIATLLIESPQDRALGGLLQSPLVRQEQPQHTPIVPTLQRLRSAIAFAS